MGAIEPVFNVQFEAMVDGYVAEYAPDGPTATGTMPNYMDDTFDHRWDGREENPLLANRLFMLGLHEWAADSQIALRNELRTGWMFVPDQFQPGEEGYSANTVWNQGNISITGSFHEGYDVAVLKAQPLQINQELLTIPFTVDRPAVFFGKAWSQGTPNLEEPSYLSHGNRWPTDTSNVVPLISLGATVVDDTISDRTERCLSYQNAGALTSVGLSRSTHDVRVGSSGGSVLVSARREDPNALSTLLLYGVLSGARLEPGDASTTWLPWTPDTPHGARVALFTALSEAQRAIIDRDPSPSADAPEPTVTGVPAVCEQLSEDSEGNVFCAHWELVSGQSRNPLPEPPGLEFTTGDEAAEPGEFARDVRCISGPMLPGVLIGVSGGLALAGNPASTDPSTVLDVGGGIGTFLGVCTPRSAVPYTDNWRFVQMIGGQVRRHLDTLGGVYALGSFDHYTSKVYEERARLGQAYVRPASTIMCPPGFLLQRIRFERRDNPSRYTHVKTLTCVANDGTTKHVSSTSSEVDATLTLKGESFSLDQLIGAPGECTGGGCADLACPVGSVIHGLKMNHDSVGRLNFAEALCITRP